MKVSFVGLFALAFGLQSVAAASCNCDPTDTDCLSSCGKYWGLEQFPH